MHEGPQQPLTLNLSCFLHHSPHMHICMLGPSCFSGKSSSGIISTQQTEHHFLSKNRLVQYRLPLSTCHLKSLFTPARLLFMLVTNFTVSSCCLSLETQPQLHTMPTVWVVSFHAILEIKISDCNKMKKMYKVLSYKFIKILAQEGGD